MEKSSLLGVLSFKDYILEVVSTVLDRKPLSMKQIEFTDIRGAKRSEKS